MTSSLQGNTTGTGQRKNGIAEYTFVKERLKLGDNQREMFDYSVAEGVQLNTTTYHALAKLVKVYKCWPSEWTIEELILFRRHPWSPKEDIVLKRWHEQKEGQVPPSEWQKLAIALNEANPDTKRTYDSIVTRIRKLGLAGVSGSHAPNFKFDYKKLTEHGMKLQDGFEIKRSAGPVLLECIKNGHKFEIYYNNIWSHSCIYCNHTDKHLEFVSEKYFKDNPEAKSLPHNIYFISFPNFKIPSVKIGIARNLMSRYRRYPEYEVIFEKQMSYYDAYTLEKLIKKEFELYITNPEELKNPSNGHSECFDPSVESKILKILNENESSTI